jgi:hypothetical protein
MIRLSLVSTLVVVSFHDVYKFGLFHLFGYLNICAFVVVN